MQWLTRLTRNQKTSDLRFPGARKVALFFHHIGSYLDYRKKRFAFKSGRRESHLPPPPPPPVRLKVAVSEERVGERSVTVVSTSDAYQKTSSSIPGCA